MDSRASIAPDHMGRVDRLFEDLFSRRMTDANVNKGAHDEVHMGPFIEHTGKRIDAEFGPEMTRIIFRVMRQHVHLGLGEPTDESEKQAEGIVNRKAFYERVQGSVAAIVRWWYGKLLSTDTLREISWRIAACQGHICSLDELWPPPQYSIVPIADHWVPLRIEDTRYGGPSKKFGKLTIYVTFRIYGGPFGGLTFTQILPYRFFTTKLAVDIGYPLYQKKHKNDLVSAHLLGLLNTQEPGFPRIDKFDAPEGLLQHNRLLWRARNKPCVKGFKWHCRECSLGNKVTDSEDKSNAYCFRATHTEPFKCRLCPRCLKEGAFDPAFNAQNCLACQLKQVSRLLQLASYG